MTIQVKIADLLIAQFTESDNPLKAMIEGKTTQEVCQLIFISFRGAQGTAKGLKLSDVGLQLLKTCVQSYDIFLGEGAKVKLPHLLYLDRISKLPYYIDNKSPIKKVLTTFDSELAMMLKLADGKIDTLIETRFRLQYDGTRILPDF
jgi:hypothetical protein